MVLVGSTSGEGGAVEEVTLLLLFPSSAPLTTPDCFVLGISFINMLGGLGFLGKGTGIAPSKLILESDVLASLA